MEQKSSGRNLNRGETDNAGEEGKEIIIPRNNLIPGCHE
jgi:hypothetical protein